MWKSYLKIALRNFWKQRLYSLINVFGLAIGLTAGIFIFLYVQDEWSYDKFHEKASRIYRITETFKNGDDFTTTAMTPYKIAPLVTAASSAVEAFTRLDTDAGSGETQIIQFGDKKIETQAITFADSTFFEVFSFPLLQGNAITALTNPNTVVLSKTQAAVVFDQQDPMGKVITIRDGFTGSSYDAMVTGIMADMPHNAHFHYDFLVSKATGDIIIPQRIDQWGWTSQYSYILLKEGHNITEVEKAMAEVKQKDAPDWFNKWSTFGTQPLIDIHLRSNVKDEIEANGNISNIYIFSIVGLFILLIASINYMNLATAHAANRAREVGMRKVIGAKYQQLIRQFLTESMLITSLALIVALIFVQLLLPSFNHLTIKSLSFQEVVRPNKLLIWVGIVLMIGLLAGSYPAFFLASFQPIKVLKGLFSKTGNQTLLLRKGLVVVQFAISIALIIGMLVIFNQWEYLRNKRLGIDTEQMLLIPIRSQSMLQSYRTFKQEMLNIPGVLGVTATSKTPLTEFGNYGVFDVFNEEDNYTVPGVGIDEDFVNVYGAEMAAGRNFRNFEADSNSIILNEAAVKLAGLKNPVGQIIKFNGDYKLTIIGVIKDFNFESLHKAIQPMYFYTTTGEFNTIAVRLRPQNINNTINQLQKTWEQFGFAENFSFTFLDEDITKRYETEARFLQVFTVLSALAIFIACLGLFGLAAYTAAQRTKEIGIRKVLGASVQSIVMLLSKDFLLLIGIAALIAFPVAGWAMNNWLESFAYRIEVQWWMLALAGIVALSIAILTISFQAIRAAVMNPVKSLRSE